MVKNRVYVGGFMETFDIKNTLMESLGIEITEVKEDGTCIATMPVDSRTKQPFGYLHGGASVALAETVASLGAASLVDLQTQAIFGQEINANHIRSKKDGIVTAIASVIHKGKTSMVYETKIVDEEENLISISRCTIAVVNKRN
jgi:uncharacterized protein (TIGR00369 family)